MRLFDAPQDSHTLMQDARGPADSLGFFNETAGHAHDTSPATTQKQPTGTARRRQLRPRVAPQLVTAGLAATDAPRLSADEATASRCAVDTATGPLDAGTLDQANAAAEWLHRLTNAARMASRATYRRGEVTAWASVVPLGAAGTSAYNDLVDELDFYDATLPAEIHRTQRELHPVITRMNAHHRTTTSFEVPAQHTRTSPWAGPAHWCELAEDTVDTARETHRTATGEPVTVDASPHNVRALLRAFAGFFGTDGTGCTAATATIVARAIDAHGATCSPATGARRFRTITRVLADAGLLDLQAKGRHLTSIERLAAHWHHGGTQTRVANRWDATVPEGLLPEPSPTPDGPAYAAGLTERLAARDAAESARIGSGCPTDLTSADTAPSTYSCGYGLRPSYCGLWGAHERAQARANTETTSSTTEKQSECARRAPVSMRSRRIADDLTRPRTGTRLDSGPYAHLCGPQRSQMSLNHLAGLIEAHTPSWSGTRDVLAGLVHAATSQATGYVALGLHTRPDSAIGWMTRVLTSIDWTCVDEHPAWWRVAEAYGFHWCGTRRHWSSIG